MGVLLQTVAEVKEACATIRKAMVQINELGANMNPQNFNQMTRWCNTKEEHCCKIITTISGMGVLTTSLHCNNKQRNPCACRDYQQAPV